MRRGRTPVVLNGQGFPVTQDEYNALMRSIANLSALVVHLEDKLDELRAQVPIPLGDSRESAIERTHGDSAESDPKELS